MFRFTIRDVLWLTVVVALGAGMRIESQHREALEEQCRLWEGRALTLKDHMRFHGWDVKWVEADLGSVDLVPPHP